MITNGDEDALELAKEHIRFYAAKTDAGYEKLIPYAEAVSLFNTGDEIETENENKVETQDETLNETKIQNENEVLPETESLDETDLNIVKTGEPIIIMISMEEGEEEENILPDITIESDTTDDTTENNVIDTIGDTVDENGENTTETIDDTEPVDEPKEPEPLVQTKAVLTVTAEGITGAIASGEETEIVLYWYWPYEYDDVPDKTQISAQSEREYDLNDTVIGNYIQSIGFTFVVEGNTVQPVLFTS